ncbi:DUF6541 family protein [Microbacterium sp. 179-I 3D2 NHS]|uniref:DUF6541 family protein n=1 Tax=Microbacterium sp. 179-I 3D2 NHS TaxID=3235178 RepID=UPI0039A2A517
MITDWLAQAGPIGLAAAVMLLPGLAIGTGLRLRGLMLWAAAPAVSVGLLALLAVVFPFLGIRWGLVGVGIAVVVVAVAVHLIAFAVTRRIAPHPTEARRRGTGLLVGGLLVGAGLNAARLMTYVGTPAAISQTNDAVFHLNALRWVAETGSASSFDLSGLIGGTSFYPAAWHAVASLVAWDNAQIPVAANAVALVIAAVVWPLGIALLARVVSRGDALVTAFAAALSAGLLAFPQLMFEWGVLYPYAVSLAVVPAAVALTITAMRLGMAARGPRRLAVVAGPGAAALLAVAATTLAQPSTVLVWGATVMLWLTSALLGRRRRSAGASRVGPLLGIVVGWAGVAVVWAALAYLAGHVLWRSYRSPVGAVADVLLNSYSLLPPALGMSALLIVGIVVLLRRRSIRWLIMGWAGVSVLYIVSVATDLPVIKRALTGPWYGDSFRLAAVVPLFVVPLAAVGLAVVVRAVTSRRHRWAVLPRSVVSPLAIAVVAAVGAVGIIVAPVILLRVAADTDEQSRYALNARSYLSADEDALLRQLPDLVPEGALIIANPSTGAALAYVLGERDVIPRTWSPPQSSAWDVLAADLRDAGDDPAVCEALAAYGRPGYVLDFGIGGTGPGEYLMPGMTGFSGRPGFEEVAAEGDASLWRITACD